jgi:hypothetical protein
MVDSTLKVNYDFGGQAAEWDRMDLPNQLQPLLASGYRIDFESGMIKSRKASGWQTPWIYTKSIDSKFCNMDHNIKFNHYNYIPPRCLNCWKVVVGPQSFAQMFKLWEVERAMDVPCKLGIELRDYTAKSYGGYFYCDSFDQGRERYEQVKKAMKEHVGDDVPVILKRGCTEYELVLGPSPFWVMPDKMKETDELLDLYVERGSMFNSRQTEYQKAHVLKKWIKWAHSRNDMSYLPWNGGKPIVPDYVKFHEGDIDAIKDELAMAEAAKKAELNGEPINPEAFMKFREQVKQISKDSGIKSEYLLKATDYMTEVLHDGDQTT